MRHLLLAKGLWGFTDGTEDLGEDADGQQRADFEICQQKTITSIVMAVSTSQWYLITSCDEPQNAKCKIKMQSKIFNYYVCVSG